LAELVDLDVEGTLNVAGTEPMSRYDYGMLLLEHFRVAKRKDVQPTSARDMRVPRPLDLTLDVSKARALLETPLVGVRDALAAAGRRRTARRGRSRRRSRSRASGRDERTRMARRRIRTLACAALLAAACSTHDATDTPGPVGDVKPAPTAKGRAVADFVADAL